MVSGSTLQASKWARQPAVLPGYDAHGPQQWSGSNSVAEAGRELVMCPVLSLTSQQSPCLSLPDVRIIDMSYYAWLHIFP